MANFGLSLITQILSPFSCVQVIMFEPFQILLHLSSVVYFSLYTGHTMKGFPAGLVNEY